MKTTIKKEFTLNEPIAKVWAYLSDPTKIVSCVPGASITEVLDEKNYKGGVTTKFGPVKASYAGDIEITEMDSENYAMKLHGVGVDSKGKGSAEMTMHGDLIDQSGSTDVKFSMEISVVGKLAQFGSRLINDVSDQLLDQFVDSFQKKLATADAAEGDVAATTADAAPAENSLNAFALMWAVIKGFFARLFGSKA
jgi:hypothetical protein